MYFTKLLSLGGDMTIGDFEKLATQYEDLLPSKAAERIGWFFDIIRGLPKNN